jgi:hypothetical protein
MGCEGMIPKVCWYYQTWIEEGLCLPLRCWSNSRSLSLASKLVLSCITQDRSALTIERYMYSYLAVRKIVHKNKQYFRWPQQHKREKHNS